MFERKNVNLKTLGQVARNTVDGDSALRVVIETNPGTISCRAIIFAWSLGCLDTPRSRPRNYLVPFLAFFVSGGLGSLAPVLVNRQFSASKEIRVLRNEVPEILGEATPNLEVHKSDNILCFGTAIQHEGMIEDARPTKWKFVVEF